MVVVGLIALFADLVFRSSWGPHWGRRTTYVDQRAGYGPGYRAYTSRWGYGRGRRRVIEEEEAGPPGPGY